MQNLSSTYRTILMDVFDSRKKRNPQYSLGAFARDLGISISRLSNVMKGRYGISVETAQKISERLEFSPKKTAFFCDLVESEHARSKLAKASAQVRLEQPSRIHFTPMPPHDFHVLNRWVYFAILELIHTEGFCPQLPWIAKSLNITLQEAQSAVKTLFDLKILEETPKGEWRPKKSYFINREGTPSDSVKKYHEEILSLALQAIEKQTSQERVSSAMTIAIHPADLPWIQEKINEFHQSLASELSNRTEKTRVYNLAVHFFALSHPVQEKMDQ